MDNINGKVLVFTDLHLGLKGAAKSRLAICVQVIKDIISYVKKNNVSTCIFCGDWHHTRVSTDNNVLNVSYKLMSALSGCCRVVAILGNHDLYMKNSVDINSLVMFKDLKNVDIVSSPEQLLINGKPSLLVPWCADLTPYPANTFDFVFGHFEIAHNYLVKSYIEEHSASAVSAAAKSLVDTDELLNSGVSSTSEAADLVGSFVDLAKPMGTVFAGHIHTRKEFISKKRLFIFVGSPYQQTLGERGNTCGFYVLDEAGKTKFVEITSTPKHIDLKMSKVVADVDNFDFSCVKGNIIHRVYDVEVDRVLDAKISQKINDWKPYDELLPDYEVDLELNRDIKMQNESIELIKKSKLDYIKNYINNIDPKVLKDQNLNAAKLFSVLEKYYGMVAED